MAERCAKRSVRNLCSWEITAILTRVANSFKYDPFGRRIYKSSSSGTSIFDANGNTLTSVTGSNTTRAGGEEIPRQKNLGAAPLGSKGAGLLFFLFHWLRVENSKNQRRESLPHPPWRRKER